MVLHWQLPEQLKLLQEGELIAHRCIDGWETGKVVKTRDISSLPWKVTVLSQVHQHRAKGSDVLP